MAEILRNKKLNRFKKLLAGIVTAVVVSISLFSALHAEESSYFDVIKKYIGGLPFKMHVKDDYAYIAAHGVLLIYDVADRNNPHCLSYIDLEGMVYDVVVINTYAYIAAGVGGIQIVDVSDPARPELKGSLTIENGQARAIVVQGNYAYVAADDEGLRIFNIQEPNNPYEVGHYKEDIRCLIDVYVTSKHAYLADTSNKIIVVNISNPNNIIRTDSDDTVGLLQNIYRYGDHIFAAAWNGGLNVFSIDDQAGTVEFITNEHLDNHVFDVFVRGDYAYVGEQTDKLYVLNVSDVNNIQVLEPALELPDHPYGLTGDGSSIFISLISGGFCIADISDPELPVLIKRINEPGGNASKMAVQGNFLYMVDSHGGMWVFDISDDDDPVVAFHYDTDFAAEGICVKDDYVYIANHDEGLEIVDVSDPYYPRRVVVKDLDGSARDVVVHGRYAYLAAVDPGVLVVDVANPESPEHVNTFDTNGYAYGLAIHGQYLYVADWNDGVVKLDISNAPNPTYVDTLQTSGAAYAVEFDEDYLYVAEYDHGFTIFDLSDPQNKKNYSFDHNVVLDVQVVNEYAYVSNYEKGVRVFKRIEGMDFEEIAYYDTPGYAFAAEFHGNNVYVCDNNAGFLVLRPHFPRVDSVSPGGVLQGQTKDITLSGKYFHAGAAVNILGGDITVNETEFLTDSSLRINITVDPEAYMTLRDIYVENPNGFENTSHSLLQV
ncbi:MAG: hypothetical protein GF384_07745, partial [Elusimicrobia bacterium]|nr:hypothetical protein [Elusimicrobiota bacterium]